MKNFRLFVAFTLICFALLPQLKAQCPSDCSGNSTAVGNNALNPASTGFNITAVGASAADLPFHEIALAFVPFDHVASRIINANHSIM